MPKHDPFSPIATSDLDHVAGGASRVSARTGAGNEQITQMLTQITSSIKDLASSKSSGFDPTMMMMMMMMGGGGGGGGGAAVTAAPAPAPTPPPAINVSVKSG